MRSSKYLVFILLSVSFVTVFGQSPSNILLIHSNAPIAFDKMEAQTIRDAVSKLTERSDLKVQQIITGKTSLSGPSGTLSVYDELQYDINDLGMKLGLLAETNPSDSVRNAANDGSQALSDYASSLVLNEPLYKAMKAFADQSLSSLKPNQQKYLTEQIRIFENNGMKLDSTGRNEMQAISNRLTMLGLEFDRNIGAYTDSLVLSEEDLKGVPEGSRAKWKRAGGEYVLYLNSPNYEEISEYAMPDATRKKMYYKYENRAFPVNIKVLDSLLYYREQYALKLGYPSYAAYALTDKMAGNPESVWNFENNLIKKLTPKVSADLTQIRAVKHTMHPELPDTIYAWDVAYYRKQLLDQKYQLNEDEVKEYFEMNQTIKGMFEVYHRLFGITVKETSGLPTWYSKVRTFEMWVGEKKLGSFYFDLYPRQNKYTHFACFGISAAHISPDKEILPVAALICNFPEAARGEPTLLSHYDVTILFHEFGHLVADMVVRSDLASQPASLKADFVEAPSQFLENFCWQYASLKIFARNYKTGAVLPESLFNKMKSTEKVLSAQASMRQVYYGLIDFTFEDKYDSIRGMDLTSVTESLHRINQIPFPSGTHMIASFTHLSGYGANYYGYLWSLVFAKDIFSVFEKNGVMDAKTGERYRRQILEAAGSEQEMDMLSNFLGREPNSDAFMKSLGL